MSSARRVLVIEDDNEIADLVAIHLRDLSYALDRAEDGLEGLAMAESGNYDLVILDLMLPKLDGLDVCTRIRQKDSHTPILMLTARSEELDKVLGLELGADDYLTKPFSIRELIARVKAIFRRMEADVEKVTSLREADTYQYGGLSIDLAKRQVKQDGEAIELTAKEFDLLALFASHPGRTYSRRQLLDLVWDYQFEGYEHTVNSHINRLRNKIEKNPAEPQYIKTVWGVGYRFVELEELSE